MDFTFLRDGGLLPVVEPDKDKRGKNIGVRHYKVEYKMYICVVDRDLKCEYAAPPTWPFVLFV